MSEEFAHGYGYSGHPVACAAGIARLNILQREKLVERVREDIGPYLQERPGRPADHPLAGEAMMTGMICREHSFNNGFAICAAGERMGIVPPLELTPAEAGEVMEKAYPTLDMALASLKTSGRVQAWY